MKVELDGAEATVILEALERKASEPTSVFKAAIRAKVRRKMRVIVAGPSPELTKALDTIMKDGGTE